jgi:hypothetical protein
MVFDLIILFVFVALIRIVSKDGLALLENSISRRRSAEVLQRSVGDADRRATLCRHRSGDLRFVAVRAGLR